VWVVRCPRARRVAAACARWRCRPGAAPPAGRSRSCPRCAPGWPRSALSCIRTRPGWCTARTTTGVGSSTTSSSVPGVHRSAAIGTEPAWEEVHLVPAGRQRQGREADECVMKKYRTIWKEAAHKLMLSHAVGPRFFAHWIWAPPAKRRPERQEPYEGRLCPGLRFPRPLSIASSVRPRNPARYSRRS
jgi:hypothetical protein